MKIIKKKKNATKARKKKVIQKCMKYRITYLKLCMFPRKNNKICENMHGKKNNVVF